MIMKIVDLSLTLRKDIISLVPGHPEFDLKDFHFHERDFRSNSLLQISTHTGTHVDAPYHFVKEGITIDELPLEKTVGKAIMVDLRKFSTPRRGFTLDQLRQSKDKKEIKEKIVILHSGWIREKWGKPELYGENPFLTQEAADWLVSQEIRAVGVDFAIDNPDQSLFPLEKKFPIHRTFLKNGIPHIENLCNLERIDCDEFLLVALPLKLYGCNGAPARAIAIID
jgi:kynurenine formamidase